VNNRLHEKLVLKKPYLFWDIGDKTSLSQRAVVERVLAFGDFDDFLVLADVLGLLKVAQIYRQATASGRCNLNSRTRHFWDLYFNRHAPSSSK